jgi:hypothetical protein
LNGSPSAWGKVKLLWADLQSAIRYSLYFNVRNKQIAFVCLFLILKTMKRGICMKNIVFASKEHKAFYTQMLAKVKNDDSSHRAFFYTMGICEETRRNIDTHFYFKERCIEPEGPNAGWQTGTTHKLCRLAFNLWNGWIEEGNEQSSTPYELFDCELSPYFFEAIRLCYPEYCHNKERIASPTSRAYPINSEKRLTYER